MAYGFRPIANDVKLANLGQIYAENQKTQMAMDNNALTQASTLATLAKAQQETESARAANELVNSPNFDFSNPQTRKQLLLQKPDLYKTLNDELKNNREMQQKTIKEMPEIAATFAQLPEEQKPAFIEKVAAAYPDFFSGESANIKDPRILGGFSLYGEAYLKSKAAQKGKGAGFRITNPDGTIVEYGADGIGGNALTKPTTNAVQTKVMEGMQNLVSLDNMKALYKPEYSNLLTQVKNQGAGFLERIDPNALNPQQQEELAGFTQWKQAVDQAFNDYRIYVTGASAPMGEINALKNTFASTSMSPTRYNAAVNQLERKYNQALKLNQMLLAEGLPLNEDENGKFPAQTQARANQLWRQIRNEGNAAPRGRQQIQSPSGDIDAMAAQQYGGAQNVPQGNAAGLNAPTTPQAGGQAPQGVISFEDFMGQQ